MENPLTNATKPDKTGEMEIDILGKRYRMKITFAACRSIERALDMSFTKLAQRMAELDVRREDMATVFHAAIVGGGTPFREAPSVQDLGEELMKHPIEGFLVEYGNLVAGVVTAGRAKRITREGEGSGEAKTQAAT